MTRINPSLTGAFQISPTATGVDTFADLRSERLVTPAILDLVPLSNVLARYVGEKEAQATEITEDIVRDVARRVEQGEDRDAVLKEYSADNLTPARVKGKLSKVFTAAGINPTANPAYIQQYREGQGDIRVASLRRSLLSDSQVSRIAKAGTDAPPGEAYNAMLKAVQESISGSDLYEGMDVFGTAAINERLLAVTEDVMAAASEVYTKELRRSVQDSFGAQTYLYANDLLGGLDSGDDTLVQFAQDNISAAYTKLRTSGEPNHREILVDSILQVAESIGAQNPQGAEEFLDSMLDLKEGTSEVFEKDIEGRARIASAQYAASQRKVTQRREQDWLDADRAEKVQLSLEEKYGGDLLVAEGVSSEAVSEVIERIRSELAYEDPKDQQTAREWLQVQGQRSVSASNSIGIADKITSDILAEIRTGSLDSAAKYLADARAEGLVRTDQYLDLMGELQSRQSHSQVYERPDVKNYGRRILDILNTATAEDGTPLLKGANAIAAASKAEEEFMDSLSAFVQSEEITNANPFFQARQVEAFVREQEREAIKRILPDTAKFADRSSAASVEEARTVNTIENLSIDSLTTAAPRLGGLDTAAQPPEIQSISNVIIGRILRTKDLSDIDVSPLAKAPVASPAARRANRVANDLEAILTDTDITDTLGNPIGVSRKFKIAAETLAYSGAFTLDELTSRTASPETIEAWGGKNRSRLKAAITHLNLSEADVYRIPVPEVGRLLLSVTQDGTVLKPRSEDKEGIEKVREYLESFGVSPTDDVVARFINHQYRFTESLNGNAR